MLNHVYYIIFHFWNERKRVREMVSEGAREREVEMGERDGARVNEI